MAEMITWTNSTRAIGDLIEWKSNPRKSTDEDESRIRESMQIFGQVETIAIGPSNELYNGHQRVKALLNEHGPDFVVDVRVSSRALTEAEQRQLTIFLHESATGQWDFEILGDTFDRADLLDWGFPEWKIPDASGPPSLDDLSAQFGDPAEDAFWPVIRYRVPPELFADWSDLVASLKGESDADTIRAIIDAAAG